MAALFFEPSALLKRWVVEAGSAWVRAQSGATRSGPRFVTRFGGVELAGSLARALRGGRVSPHAHAIALAELHADLAGRLNVVEVTRPVLDRAMALATAHGLRGADAVHLAGACLVNDVRRAQRAAEATFVSADAELLAAAVACGLAIDNPLHHSVAGE